MANPVYSGAKVPYPTSASQTTALRKRELTLHSRAMDESLRPLRPSAPFRLCDAGMVGAGGLLFSVLREGSLIRRPASSEKGSVICSSRLRARPRDMARCGRDSAAGKIGTKAPLAIELRR